MTRLARIGSNAGLALATALFAAGIAATRVQASRDDGGATLKVDEPIRRFEDAATGEIRWLTFTVSNRGERPLSLLGSADLCTRQGCVHAEGLPLTIPGRQRRDLRIHVEAGGVGDFAADLTVYTSAPGQSEIVFGIRGKVVREHGGG